MRMRTVGVGLAIVALLTTSCTGRGGDGITVTVTVPATGSSTSAAAPVAASTGPTASATASTPATLKQAFDRMKGAAARVETAACDGYGSGSAFMLSPRLAVTAAHVVENSERVRLIVGNRSAAATVIGYDLGRDVALLRSAVPLSDTVVGWTTEPAQVGDPVATVGYSLGGALSFHAGVVNGLNRKVNIEGRTGYGLIEHDTAAMPGDSGAPLINAAGRVVGIQDAGLSGEAGQRLAVDAKIAAPLVAAWRADPEPGKTAGCPDVMVAFGGGEVQTQGFQAKLPSSWQTVMTYIAAMNRGDYQVAASQWINQSPTELESGSRSVQFLDFTALDMYREGANKVIWVQFRSTQTEGEGPSARPNETCTVWSQEYVLKPKNGLFLILRTRDHEGTSRHQPCG